MHPTVELDEQSANPSLRSPRLEITVHQIVDDRLLKQNRVDGSGWDWCWADWQRDWMDASQGRFAYRCLPLTIANQTGLWINNPVGFSATWRGQEGPGSIEFNFDVAGDVWENWVTNIFGLGIITWNTPFLFRTKPEGSRLLVSGPANHFKDNVHALTALIESDWMNMSFTMNWKIMKPDEPIRFEAGEPLFQAIPLASNVCSDLEGALVVYRHLDDDAEVAAAYREWDRSRSRFTAQSKAGERKPDDWQRDYFLGRDASGRQVAPAHMTKVKPPKIIYKGAARPAAAESGPAARGQTSSEQSHQTQKQSPVSLNAEVDTPSRRQSVADWNGTVIVTAGAVPLAPQVNDEWRRWIAENLLRGASRDAILGRMVAAGFLPSDSLAEIEQASRSPDLLGPEQVRDREHKRD
jgi:hypothetical protein